MLGQHDPGRRDQPRTYGPAITYPLLLAFFFSLLQANWTYTGYDASAHVAEETVGARVASAWGVFLSVAVSAVVGLHLPARADHSTCRTSRRCSRPTLDDPAHLQPVLLRRRRGRHRTSSSYNLGDGLGGILGGGHRDRHGFCGLSSVASAGRMLFAFSRDDGVPGSGWLKKVSHRYRTPANSLIASSSCAGSSRVVGVPASAAATAIVIVTAISTIFLYAAYGICIYLGATTEEWLRGAGLEPGPLVQADRLAWRVFWIVVLMVLFCFPTSGNISLAVHGRDRRLPARLLLRLGAHALQGTAGPWATRPS